MILNLCNLRLGDGSSIEKAISQFFESCFIPLFVLMKLPLEWSAPNLEPDSSVLK
jgi:hypothetical protein